MQIFRALIAEYIINVNVTFVFFLQIVDRIFLKIKIKNIKLQTDIKM